jgi:hypothetical protein
LKPKRFVHLFSLLVVLAALIPGCTRGAGDKLTVLFINNVNAETDPCG